MSQVFNVCDRLAANFEIPWPSPSNDTLWYGSTGVAYFLWALHTACPNEGWGSKASAYLRASIKTMTAREDRNCSLFIGLSGLAAVTFLVSQSVPQATAWLAVLDEIVLANVENVFVLKAEKFIDSNHLTPPNYYNFNFGLSGIIKYLLLRRDSYVFSSLLGRCVEQMSRIMLSEKQIDNEVVPSWFVGTPYLRERELQWCPNGGIFLNAPLGIAGCLSALSSSALQHVKTPHLLQAIEKLSLYLKQQIDPTRSFSSILPFRGAPIENLDYEQDSWALGWPAVLRSLYLAGSALGRKDLCAFAQENFVLFWKQRQRSFGASFGLGDAGLLTISSLLATDSGDPEIYAIAQSLERDILQSFNPAYPFGFKPAEGIDDLDLYFGYIGTGLALLFSQDRLHQHQLLLTY
jgi:hypothetical protein